MSDNLDSKDTTLENPQIAAGTPTDPDDPCCTAPGDPTGGPDT